MSGCGLGGAVLRWLETDGEGFVVIVPRSGSVIEVVGGNV